MMHPVSRNMARLMRRIRRRDMKIEKLKRELHKIRKTQLQKMRAPIAFITEGQETGKEPTVIIGTCWSIGGPFCIEMGGKYAVFKPQSRTIRFISLRGYEKPLPDAAFLYRLSRIDDQAAYPILCPLDALVQQ